MQPYSESCKEFRLLSVSLYCFLPCNSSLVLLSLISEVIHMCEVECCLVSFFLRICDFGKTLALMRLGG